MTKHTSIAEWAGALGSSAKTHAGQRRAIINSFPALATQIPVERRGSQPSSWMTKSIYLYTRERARQERFAETHPLTLAHPAPATVYDVRGTSAAIVPLARLQAEHNSHQYSTLSGDWVIRTAESASYNNNCYSKSWHARYGGKRIVDSRTVLCRRVLADGTLEARDFEVPAWRGNYLLDGLVRADILPNNRTQLALRIHPAYELEVERRGRNVTIYRRVLGGALIDYVAARGTVNYHADTAREALSGLRHKARRRPVQRGKAVTVKLCRALGFCWPGLRDVCAVTGFDLDGVYSAQEIEQAVRSNWSRLSQYESEFRTLAKTLNYSVEEFEE